MSPIETPIASGKMSGAPLWHDARRCSKMGKIKTTPCSDKEPFSQTGPPPSRLVRVMFIPFCLAGVVESPTVLWNGKSSLLYKIYSGVLCALTFLSCVRHFYSLWYYTEDPLARILKPRLTFYCRLIYTIVAVKALGYRLVCFNMFNFEHRRIADAYARLASDPALKQSLELRSRPFVVFHVVVSLAVFLFLAVNSRLSMMISDSLRGWDYLMIVNTSVVSVSSIAYSQGLLSLIAHMTVCDVLRKGRSYFVDAVRCQRVKMLREAIEVHKRGHEFVRAVNTKFRIMLGVSLSAAVPLFSAVCTFLSTSHRNAVTEMMILMYIAILLSVSAVVVSVYVAARVNNELEMHAEVLRNSDVDDEEFEKVSKRFLRQFNKRPGFTFFGFGTVTLETGLTAFGLMTNYYIVGIQLDSLYKQE